MTLSKNDQNHDSELMQNLLKLAEEYNVAYQDMLKKQQEMMSSAAMREFTNAFFNISGKMLENPEELIRQQAEIGSEYLKIWGNVLSRSMGEKKPSLYEADHKDRRFRDPTWDENFVFDFLKQSYLMTSQHMRGYVQQLEGFDEKTTRKFDFYTQQFLDAVSPSNFALTNPKVVKETLDHKGENLLKGFRNLVEDLQQSKGLFQVSTTDNHAFEVGKNVAVTKGRVVYQNDLMQLIHYQPTKKQVYEVPVLIVPAWINKYYILDLSPENSLAHWLLEQGFSVFMISWVNPDKRLQDKSFEDYMKEGPLAALDVIEKTIGAKQAHAMGYCLGGTLLTCTLAYLEAKKQQKRIASATLLTTLVDFTHAGQLGDLIDEELVASIEKEMLSKGYFDGAEMASMFSMLRANDMIWSFVVNNYLLGKTPFPFDILYWNADCTRLPARMHSFYLRKMYLDNALIQKGGITLDGVELDISKITTPIYALATKDDHIAPWVATYEVTKLLKNTAVRYVLSASGHVGGVVNPPIAGKYHYWLNDKKDANADQWFNGAKEHGGSWWLDWAAWAAPKSGKKVAAPQPKQAIEAAPGSYVKERC